MNDAWKTVSCARCGADAGKPCRGEFGEPSPVPCMARIRRGREESDFWRFIDDRLADPTCSMTEQELLDSIAQPGWTGRRARPPRNVVPMPAPPSDFRRAAAGDRDDDEAA